MMTEVNFSGLVLLIPEKEDIERDAVAEVWEKYGGKVIRVGRFWEPPLVKADRVRIYGNNIFCLILAEKYGLKLVSPDDEFLFDLSESWLKRKIQLKELSEVDHFVFPCFIKPLVPKLFAAKVYHGKGEFLYECRQLEGTTKLIISEIVNVEAEVRAFILNGEIMSMALYEGQKDLENCKTFLQGFLTENKDKLVKTLVIDAGYFEDKGWGIIEANASWGAGLNGCEPEGGALCIAQAVSAAPVK
jgi:hypothetical protein